MEGDTLLLCTDGLWTLVEDDEIGIILHASPVNEALPELLDLAESRADEHGDNMSAIALHWGERQDDQLTVSTVTMPLGATATIINPISQLRALTGAETSAAPDLSDDDIERAIADIQAAIRKTQR
jgi:serine/threonine protein phosphatase PrpC